MATRKGQTQGKARAQLTPPSDSQSGDLSPWDGIGSIAGSARCSALKRSLAFVFLMIGFIFVQPAFAGNRTISRDQLAGAISAQSAAECVGYRRDLVMMFFLTSMLFLLLWAILNYFQDRQPEVGLFAIHQSVYTLLGIAAAGCLSLFSHGGLAQLEEWASAILYFAINVTTLLFCRELFKIYEPPRLLMRGADLLVYTCPALLLVFALGFKSIAIESNAVLIAITWLYLAITVMAFHVDGTPRRWIMRAFFIIVCMADAAFWLGSRSGRITSPLTLREVQLLLVNGLAVSGFFVVILKARALHAQRTAQQSFLDLLRVQKKFEIEKELKKQAEVQAQTDFLTGVFNRRCFVESAERELDRAMRFNRPLSLLMFDIDHFKSINDTWGHAMGDIVLQKVSHLIRDALRTGDIFGRTGGEEFAAVLVKTEGDSAFHVSQRLCAMVADAVIEPQGAGRIPVTISIGLAQLKGRNISFSELMNEADQAMYAAKTAGRNRVSVSA